MIARRAFLRVLGISPLAAKQIADQKVQELSSGFKALTPPVYSQGTCSADPEYAEKKAEQLSAIAKHFDVFGVPPWFEEELRAQCNYVAALDPDLAAKRSWSMSVKIAEQRDRNYKRRLASIAQGARYNAGRAFWQKLTGRLLEYWG